MHTMNKVRKEKKIEQEGKKEKKRKELNSTSRAPWGIPNQISRAEPYHTWSLSINRHLARRYGGCAISQRVVFFWRVEIGADVAGFLSFGHLGMDGWDRTG